MPILKKKVNGSWTTIVNPSDFPTTIGIKKVSEPIRPMTLNITRNGTYTPTSPYNAISQVTANVSGPSIPNPIVAGDTPVLISSTRIAVATQTSSLQPTGVYIDIPFTGTYRFKWVIYETNESTMQSRLYKNGTAVGTTISANDAVKTCSLDLECTAGDRVEVYLKGTRYDYVLGDTGALIACIDWDIWG